MPDSDQIIRQAKEVAKRCLVLYGVLAVSHREPREKVVSWLKRENLWDVASFKERLFLENELSSEWETINVTWRAEALWVLLWTLGKIEDLGTANTLCDPSQFHSIFQQCDKSTVEFINNARLRSDNEIFDREFEVYNKHWLIRDAELNGKEPPKELNSDVVQEWHYAFNWLTYNVDWDDVTTDT